MAIGKSKSFSRTLFLTLFILAVFVTVASFLLVLLMGYGFVFFTSEGVALSMQSGAFPVLLFLFLIVFYTPPLPIGTVFGFIWIVYVVCFVAAWKWRESFHSVVSKSFSRPFRSLFGNFLFIMPLISSMVLTAAWAIISSQEFVGVPTGQAIFPPEMPQQEVFLNLAYAPVIEELGFRLIPIGLFIMFYVFLYGKKSTSGGFKPFVASILYPEGAKRMVGLRNVSEHGFWRGISGGEWAMVLVTSVVFAFAHIISGIGWEPGKVTSVFVQGFFFAVTYLVYGFEAPILLHWFFNYYLFFFDPDILSKFFPATDPILTLVELVILGLGVAGWVAFAIVGLRKLIRRPEKEQMPPVPVSPEATLPS